MCVPRWKGPRERAVSTSIGGYNAVIGGCTWIITILRRIGNEMNGLGQCCAVIRVKFAWNPRIYNNIPHRYAFVLALVHVHACVCMYCVCVCACMYFLYVCTCAYVSVCVCVCVCTRIQHTCTHTTHIYVFVDSCLVTKVYMGNLSATGRAHTYMHTHCTHIRACVYLLVVA